MLDKVKALVRLRRLFLLLTAVVISLGLWPVAPKSVRASSETKSLAVTTNIHNTGRYCSQCHQGRPRRGRKAALKYGGDPNRLCRCHFSAQKSYWHPTDVYPGSSPHLRVPAELPLRLGKISCITCHDIYRQCLKSSVKVSTLRGDPSGRPVEFCLRCHRKEDYTALNPHRQIDDQGGIITAVCLNCHTTVPPADYDGAEPLEFIGELGLMCQRCHMITGNHSGNVSHMGKKPKTRTLAYMTATAARHNAILPLDENGKVTCVTCHNPHDAGVIADGRPAAKGADVKKRHRLPGNICTKCHNK